jgi:hypothetical protein
MSDEKKQPPVKVAPTQPTAYSVPKPSRPAPDKLRSVQGGGGPPRGWTVRK